MTLHARLAAIADAFAAELLRTVRAAPLEELAGVEQLAARRPPMAGRVDVRPARVRRTQRARPARKPTVDVGATTKHVLGVLRLLPNGAPPAALRENLALDKAQWVAFINDACAQGIVRKTGERRGTRYFLGPKANS